MALWSNYSTSRRTILFLAIVGALALLALSVELATIYTRRGSPLVLSLNQDSSGITLKRSLHPTLPRVMAVFGTRPEAIKMAPVIQQLQAQHSSEVDTVVVSVGQHREMLASVLRAEAFKDIKIDVDLDLMTVNQTLSSLAARALYAVSEAIQLVKPQVVVVQGDTSSAMVASEAAFYERVPEIAHVEAGLRTYDRYNPYPEDVNRRLIGVTGTTHFPPTWVAANNLLNEAGDTHSIFTVGNTVIDSVLKMISLPPSNKAREILNELDIPVDQPETAKLRTILVTAHRRESFGGQMREMMLAMRAIVEQHDDVQLVYPVHLNPNVREQVDAVLTGVDRVRLMPPLDYQEFVHVLSRVTLVLTDSGGLQEECSALRKPVLVMRKTTERPEGVTAGVSQIVGTAKDDIINAVSALLLNTDNVFDRMSRPMYPYGDGLSGKRIAAILANKAHGGCGASMESGPATSLECAARITSTSARKMLESVPVTPQCSWARTCEMAYIWEKILLHSIVPSSHGDMYILDASGGAPEKEVSCDDNEGQLFAKYIVKQIPRSKLIIAESITDKITPKTCFTSTDLECAAPDDDEYQVIFFAGATAAATKYTNADAVTMQIKTVAQHVKRGGVLILSIHIGEQKGVTSLQRSELLECFKGFSPDFEEITAGDDSGVALLNKTGDGQVSFHAFRRRVSDDPCPRTVIEMPHADKSTHPISTTNTAALSKEIMSTFTLKPKPDWPHPEQRDIPALLSLPERPDCLEKVYTCVIGMYRRPEVVDRMFNAMLAQTIRPKEVWIALWNSPNEGEILEEIEKWRVSHEEHRDWIKVVVGQPDLKYWGRFQLALQVLTPYLVVLDDDCIPQPKWAELALHCLCTDEYHGLLGLKGHPADRPAQLGMDFWGPVAKTPVIMEADVVGGAWILEAQHLRLIYRENPWTWNTGEDFNMAHHFHKYGNMRSFVLPHDETRLEYAGVTPDYLDISYAKDTTGAFGFLPLRYDLTEYLYRRGTARINSDGRWETPSVLAFIDNYDQAPQMAAILRYVNGITPLNCGAGATDKKAEVGMLFGGSSASWENQMVDLVGKDLWDATWARYANWNVTAADAHPAIKMRQIDWISNTMFTTNMVIQADGPAFIVLPADSSFAATGAALAAQHAKVPIVALIRNDSGQKQGGYEGASNQLSAATIRQLSVYASADPCEIANYILSFV